MINNENYLRSIAKKLGADVSKRHNTNQYLKEINDRIGELGTGSGYGGGWDEFIDELVVELKKK